MTLRVADRILETTTTTGTGALALAGAVTGYRRFNAIPSIATSDTLYYVIWAVDGSGNPSGDWECGLGTYSSADTLTRTTPSASTNGGAAVNFAAGTKYVALDANAAFLALYSQATGASGAETTTGTSTAKYVTPDGLAGSEYGVEIIQILVTDPNGSVLTTGDGKAYCVIPQKLNGWNLVRAAAHVTTVSSSGTPTVQIHNLTQTADMLTTRVTIDANEKSSATAAAAAVIDTGNDDVATGDEIRIDVDVAGTGTKGLIVTMAFQLP